MTDKKKPSKKTTAKKTKKPAAKKPTKKPAAKKSTVKASPKQEVVSSQDKLKHFVKTPFFVIVVVILLGVGFKQLGNVYNKEKVSEKEKQCISLERKVNHEIDKGFACKFDKDCVVFDPGCPFSGECKIGSIVRGTERIKSIQKNILEFRFCKDNVISYREKINDCQIYWESENCTALRKKARGKCVRGKCQIAYSKEE